ncbi:MAG: hypothetical protein HYX69_21770 [Planctomycetia bacterium]|nr:hypothetical protein [Planctomycetia bacterium]
MERRSFLLASLVLSLAAAGCGSSSGTSDGSTARVENVPPPDQSVREFLEAVRTGNDAKAAQLLTDLARQETAKHELVVAPPGSETARFEVGKTEFVTADVAHVASTWTDTGEDGQPRSDEIIWMLRRDPAGWRIAGMATKVFKDELPLLLDFEDPEDMVRKQRMAEEEMQRRAAATESPATQTAAPPPKNVLRQ